MSELKICRICLNKDVKMYKYDKYQLKFYYEQIMASEVNERDGLPQWFCFECATMLHKFHKFKEKCYRGQAVLEEMLWIGPVTSKAISEIDRQSRNLQSPFQVINRNERVKTYFIKSKTIVSKGPSRKRKLIKQKKLAYGSTLDAKNEVKSVIESELQLHDEEKILDKQIDNRIPVVVLEKIYVDKEKIPVVIEKIFTSNDIYNEKIPIVENVYAVKDDDDEPIVIDIDDKVSEDDEAILEPTAKLTDEFKNVKSIDRRAGKSKGVTNNKDNNKTMYLFQRSKKKKFLDPKHWEKINLTEEEAQKEFQARALVDYYLNSEYKCTFCIKGFSKEEMLTRHMRLRHCQSLGPLECRFCHKRFKWKSRLQKHLMEHYLKFNCLRCNHSCPIETSAFLHDAYHNGVTKTCKHCGEVFRHSSTYYTHLRTHRSAHVCTLCGVSFVSEAGLVMHKKVKHIPEAIKEEQAASTYCEKCDIKFVTLKAYEEHLSQSALHAESYDDPEETQEKTPVPLRKKTKSSVRKIPTTCSQCGKHFASQIGCMRHHKAEHRDIPYALNERRICEICGASLALASMQSHLNTHTRQVTHPCPTCSMRFVSKQTMQRHQLRHTGEKPFKCRVHECDKRFTQVGSMMLHYRTFHLKQPYPKRNRRKKIEQESD